jgi:hypothetical protein
MRYLLLIILISTASAVQIPPGNWNVSHQLVDGYNSTTYFDNSTTINVVESYNEPYPHTAHICARNDGDVLVAPWKSRYTIAHMLSGYYDASLFIRSDELAINAWNPDGLGELYDTGNITTIQIVAKCPFCVERLLDWYNARYPIDIRPPPKEWINAAKHFSKDTIRFVTTPINASTQLYFFENASTKNISIRVFNYARPVQVQVKRDRTYIDINNKNYTPPSPSRGYTPSDPTCWTHLHSEELFNPACEGWPDFLESRPLR